MLELLIGYYTFLELRLTSSRIKSCVFNQFSEYASVDRALDEMLTFMDVLEERSDDLFAKMQQLLAESRQTREEMPAARERETGGPSSPGDPQLGS